MATIMKINPKLMNKKYLDDLKTKYSLEIPKDHAVLITASKEEDEYKIVVSKWEDVLPTIMNSFSGSYDVFKGCYMETYEETGNILLAVSFIMGLEENDEIKHTFSAELIELQLNNNQ